MIPWNSLYIIFFFYFNSFFKVQSEVSKFVTTNTILLNFPPIFSVLYFGPLSDQYGRKPFMILATGGLLFLTLSVITIELTGIDIAVFHIGALISGICGHLPGLISAIMAYLSDTVSKENLPLRLGEYVMFFLSLFISKCLSKQNCC